jgi:integrase
MRLGELLSLQWDHIDMRKRVAFLPETKNGDSRTVPLSSLAIEVLKMWPRSVSGRVFPHWARTDSCEHAWRRAIERAGLKDLRFHDLRHEAAAITGHKTLQMLKRYTHLRAEDLAKKLE